MHYCANQFILPSSTPRACPGHLTLLGTPGGGGNLPVFFDNRVGHLTLTQKSVGHMNIETNVRDILPDIASDPAGSIEVAIYFVY